MDKLDGIVTEEVTKRVLEPQRLTDMLQTYVMTASDRKNADRDHVIKLPAADKEVEAEIMRLLELVENGLMPAEDAELEERLIGLKLQRDEIARGVGDLQKRTASGEPGITPEKVARLAVLLRDKLHGGPPAFSAQFRSSRNKALAKTIILRMTAVMATLAGFPASTSLA